MYGAVCPEICLKVSGVVIKVSIGQQQIQSSTLYVVATPIGNLADITQRALDTLAQVSVIAAEDTRTTRKLLSFYAIDNKLLSLHEHNEHEKVARLIQKLSDGDSIALVSDAGTPLINDPGYQLVRACRENNLAVVPVPGVSAVISALSASGLATDSFRYCGFAPRQGGKRRQFFEKLAKDSATLVFYESSHRIADCLEDALSVFGANRRACLAREITKHFETFKTDTLDAILDFVKSDANQQKGEFVLMIEAMEEHLEADNLMIDTDLLLTRLLAELPVKKAASIVAELTGLKKNDLYQRALQLKQEK